MTTSTFTANETNYKTTKFFIGKTQWAVTVATGKSNYVNVNKVSNNPFRSLGKDYSDFDAAVAAYKNPTMKMQLRLIETGLFS